VEGTLIFVSPRFLLVECICTWYCITFYLGTCESEISVRIESRIESGVVVYMFNPDCHMGVVYLIMCKPTTYTACYVVCSVFFVCTVGLCVYNLLITYDDDDDETESLHQQRPKRANGDSTEFGKHLTWH